MSSPSDILSRALNDRFREVSNPVNAGHDFLATLRNLVRATNKAFEMADRSLGSTYHFIMDIDEAGCGSPLRPQPDKSLVFFLTLNDTCASDVRKILAPVPEPSLLMRFHGNGLTECIATKEPIVDEHAKKIKINRSETFRAYNRNGIESFIASWFRKNLDSKTMVAVQEAIYAQESNEEAVWSDDQINRLKAYQRNKF